MRTSRILCALAFGQALMAPPALAQTGPSEPPEWRLVVSAGGTDLYYDAATVLATEDGVRVRTRAIVPDGAELPGGEGEYDSAVEMMLIDCEAGEYVTGERAFFDVNGAELSTAVPRQGPQAYEPDSGVGMIAGMVCPLPVTPVTPVAPPAD